MWLRETRGAVARLGAASLRLVAAGKFARGPPDSRRSRMVELALRPEPRPKARNLPTRYGARDVGAQANRIRLAGPAPRYEKARYGADPREVVNEQEFRQTQEAAEAEAADDAQGASQRQACGQEARLRLLSPSGQVGNRRSSAGRSERSPSVRQAHLLEMCGKDLLERRRKQ